MYGLKAVIIGWFCIAAFFLILACSFKAPERQREELRLTEEALHAFRENNRAIEFQRLSVLEQMLQGTDAH